MSTPIGSPSGSHHSFDQNSSFGGLTVSSAQVSPGKNSSQVESQRTSLCRDSIYGHEDSLLGQSRTSRKWTWINIDFQKKVYKITDSEEAQGATRVRESAFDTQMNLPFGAKEKVLMPSQEVVLKYFTRFANSYRTGQNEDRTTCITPDDKMLDDLSKTFARIFLTPEEVMQTVDSVIRKYCYVPYGRSSQRVLDSVVLTYQYLSYRMVFELMGALGRSCSDLASIRHPSQDKPQKIKLTQETKRSLSLFPFDGFVFSKLKG